MFTIYSIIGIIISSKIYIINNENIKRALKYNIYTKEEIVLIYILFILMWPIILYHIFKNRN